MIQIYPMVMFAEYMWLPGAWPCSVLYMRVHQEINLWIDVFSSIALGRTSRVTPIRPADMIWVPPTIEPKSLARF
jgi:hypothetical protein